MNLFRNISYNKKFNKLLLFLIIEIKMTKYYCWYLDLLWRKSNKLFLSFIVFYLYM